MFASSGGKLNDLLTRTAEETLIKLGKNVSTLKIADGYHIDRETDKILASDCILSGKCRFGGWPNPGQLKNISMKFLLPLIEKSVVLMDVIVLTPQLRYGTGGKLHIKYMISSTWNAPQEAFYDEGGFFEAGGIDKIWYSFHKAMQFIGMSALPSFMCNDVMKNPQIEQYIEAYQNHLKEVFYR